jgi:hypothetical protein
MGRLDKARVEIWWKAVTNIEVTRVGAESWITVTS